MQWKGGKQSGRGTLESPENNKLFIKSNRQMGMALRGEVA